MHNKSVKTAIAELEAYAGDYGDKPLAVVINSNVRIGIEEISPVADGSCLAIRLAGYGMAPMEHAFEPREPVAEHAPLYPVQGTFTAQEWAESGNPLPAHGILLGGPTVPVRNDGWPLQFGIALASGERGNITISPEEYVMLKNLFARMFGARSNG